MAARQFKSDAFEAIHSAASALHEVGTIDKATMRTFDKECLIPTPHFAPAQIKAIRESNHVSQPVFAHYLNISESTVQKWESGAKQPSGMALRLLSVIQKLGLKALA